MHRGRLVDLQAQQVEVGRIRLGSSQPKVGRSGKTYNEPVKLETFRLTSRSKQLIDEAAELYGGECEPWEPQNGGAQQWQVYTQRKSIPVIVPPNPISQYYELWTGGRCARRCDGQRELLEEQACLCGPDPSNRQCKPTTRLSLMLAEMTGIGVWRLETHGYYSAVELPAVADLLSAAGGNVPARLEMEERSAIIPNSRTGKDDTVRFMVPVLHVGATPAMLIATFQPRDAIEAPTAVPAIAARPASAPPAPSAPPAAVASDRDEQTKQYWRLCGDLETSINQTSTREGMMRAREAIQASGLPTEFMQRLQVLWNDRAMALAQALGQALAQAPPDGNGATPQQEPSAPPPPQIDRQAVYMEIQTWGGYNNQKLSDLRTRYSAFSSGGDLRTASAEELVSFRDHLKAQQ